jgi:voltage-gated potassium channel
MTPFKQALRIVAHLGSILLVGVLGYHFIERWPFFDALYMTIITLATVGYGETHPLSTAGRVFTMFLIMGGMGIILYGLTAITTFIVEGEMSGILRRQRMNRMINKLSKHYILCGLGNTGYYVLEELLRTRRPAVVVEKDLTKVNKLAEKGIFVVEGDATSDASLDSAGIRRAEGLITALPTDRDNLFVVITARGLNPTLRIIAKIDEVSSRDKFLRSGASAAISSDFIGGLRMVSEMVRPETTSFLDTMLRDSSALRVEDVHLDAESRFANKPLGSCDIFTKAGVLVLSVKQGDTFRFNPPPNMVLNAGDTLVVIGSPEQLQTVRSALHYS